MTALHAASQMNRLEVLKWMVRTWWISRIVCWTCCEKNWVISFELEECAFGVNYSAIWIINCYFLCADYSNFAIDSLTLQLNSHLNKLAKNPFKLAIWHLYSISFNIFYCTKQFHLQNYIVDFNCMYVDAIISCIFSQIP
jgi:hypothetical protein